VKLRHLEVFHAVMLAGTLSGAARLLHLSQPAATQSLQSAQRQWGHALFTRQKNRLVPTAEALALLPEISRLMGQLESVR
jgi:DNA-binding transcriptional LysR family regulator